MVQLLPTQMYKLQTEGPLNVQLSGRLFNAGFQSVPLYRGWNWMGYPVARTMATAEALEKLQAEEGDLIIGQGGIAIYNDGQWTGTLTEMNPGQGYMFHSVSDKNLFFNATAQSSSRRAQSSIFNVQSSIPEEWTVNKRKYPNVMGMIVQLWHDNVQADNGEWLLAAFCGDECRGVAQQVGDVLMMNVYGSGSETITFYVQNCETSEVLPVDESEPFQAEVLGTMQQPYVMHIGEKTGISLANDPSTKNGESIYQLDGRRVADSESSTPSSSLRKGIYVVTGGAKTKKMVRR